MELILHACEAAFVLGGALASIQVVRAYVKGVEARLDQALGEFRTGLANVNARLDAHEHVKIVPLREHI